MSSEEIDKIFEAFKKRDWVYIWNCAEIGIPFNVHNWNNYVKRVCEEIVRKIEQGDFKYFLTKKYGNQGDINVFIKLLPYSSDIEEMKACIEQRESLGLDSYDVYQLIKEINNVDYMKECIEQRESLGLDSDEVFKLIEEIDDSEYIKECIKQKESLGLDSSKIHYLIEKIDEPEFTKKCIIQGKNIGLTSKAIVSLIICKINDLDYIKGCIEQGKNIGLNSYHIYRLIKKIDNPNFAKKCIKHAEEIEINNLDLKRLLLTYDNSYLNKMLEENYKIYTREINLPTEMTIGIEIESIGRNYEFFEENKSLFLDWECENDSSLEADKEDDDEYGIEIISPILTGSNKSTTQAIRRIGIILNEIEQHTNDTCGGHIHIGADYLTNVRAWQNLLELWANTEIILYIIGNEQGHIPRSGVFEYAKPISAKLESALTSETIQLNDESDLERFKNEIIKFQYSRYKGINFFNLEDGENNTIEFRLPNGTINPDTWVENINLFGGIVNASQELSIIQNKPESELTEQEKRRLESFENIRNNNLDEKAKLECLLEIVVPEQNRDIYRQRYDVNSKLLKDNPVIESEIKAETSKRGVKISKDKIGKTIFSGDNRITGEEEQFTEQIIGKAKQRTPKDIV